MKTQSADIEVWGNGLGFYEIIGTSAAGDEWLSANVSGAEDIGGAVHAATDQTSYAHDITDGAFNDGLTIEVNGKRYLGDNHVAA